MRKPVLITTVLITTKTSPEQVIPDIHTGAKGCLSQYWVDLEIWSLADMIVSKASKVGSRETRTKGIKKPLSLQCLKLISKTRISTDLDQQQTVREAPFLELDYGDHINNFPKVLSHEELEVHQPGCEMAASRLLGWRDCLGLRRVGELTHAAARDLLHCAKAAKIMQKLVRNKRRQVSLGNPFSSRHILDLYSNILLFKRIAEYI
jgi:hypothetical protein